MDDLFFPGPRQSFYLGFSNQGFGMGQPFLLIQEFDGEASSGVGCPPTLTMLLDPSLDIFCDPRVERPIPAAEDINGPILSSRGLHPLDHFKVFSLHIHSGLI